ncbi:hypothetical protein HPB50_002155 [Hyalomma asiaticum]|uniref:Uncharacterized protein n=1 Tax=Hyalomma asiaticum TaxID=266040 RepID=A0ACB7RLK8_HYAAI|nr:hypothetical protein HPB50_002155 [Hyalomma asiaticum]
MEQDEAVIPAEAQAETSHSPTKIPRSLDLESPLPTVQASPWEGDKVKLTPGVVIEKEQWQELVEVPRDSLFVRQMAKALWGIENLRNRSVTGTPCRRYINQVGDTPPPVKRALSPVKLRALKSVIKPEPGAALDVESSVSQFSLNLDALPRNVQLALKEPQPLPPRERRQLVRCITDDMFRVSIRPRRDFIRSVAEAIVRHFPASLEDRGIDGKVLGRGYDSLLKQLENRVENESRRNPRAPLTVTLKTARKHSYGCANWQPLDLQPAQTTDERIQFLKEEGRKALRDINVPLALTHMEATYSEQRSYINSEEPTHNISEMKEEWPLLFHKPFFYRHAYQLLGKDVKVIFEDSLRTIAPLLVKHLHTLPAPRREVLEWILKVELQERRGNQKAKEEATIPLLAAYFKDNAGYMVRVLETLSAGDCVSDVDLRLRVDSSDIHEFLVRWTSFITRDQMKSRKALKGHNFVTSGLREPWVKKVAAYTVIVVTQVQFHGLAHHGGERLFAKAVAAYVLVHPSCQTRHPRQPAAVRELPTGCSRNQ